MLLIKMTSSAKQKQKTLSIKSHIWPANTLKHLWRLVKKKIIEGVCTISLSLVLNPDKQKCQSLIFHSFGKLLTLLLKFLSSFFRRGWHCTSAMHHSVRRLSFTEMGKACRIGSLTNRVPAEVEMQALQITHSFV